VDQPPEVAALFARAMELMRPLTEEAGHHVGDDHVARFRWAAARIRQRRPEDAELLAALAAFRSHPTLAVFMRGLQLPGDLIPDR
jgi:hypothetical protein